MKPVSSLRNKQKKRGQERSSPPHPRRLSRRWRASWGSPPGLFSSDHGNCHLVAAHRVLGAAEPAARPREKQSHFTDEAMEKWRPREDKEFTHTTQGCGHHIYSPQKAKSSCIYISVFESERSLPSTGSPYKWS